jgi:hypothetical protein
MEAIDASRPGDALKSVFHTLNLLRLQYNMDTYGQVCACACIPSCQSMLIVVQGRTPWFVDPAVIIHLADGGLCVYPSEVSDQVRCAVGVSRPLTCKIIVSPEDSQWCLMTGEPFRWDQVSFFCPCLLPS